METVFKSQGERDLWAVEPDARGRPRDAPARDAARVGPCKHGKPMDRWTLDHWWSTEMAMAAVRDRIEAAAAELSRVEPSVGEPKQD